MTFNIVLDLDATLISSQPADEYDAKKERKKASKFKHHDMDGYFEVFERPGLQKFLDFLFTNFNVSVWTAATQSYAIFVVDHVILKGHPERKLDYVFFNYHCKRSEKMRDGSKDLRLLWENFELPGYGSGNTVIIDDLDEVCELQPCNCLPAKPFEYSDDGSENDTFLEETTEILRKLLSMKGKADGDVCLVKDVIMGDGSDQEISDDDSEISDNDDDEMDQFEEFEEFEPMSSDDNDEVDILEDESGFSDVADDTDVITDDEDDE